MCVRYCVFGLVGWVGEWVYMNSTVAVDERAASLPFGCDVQGQLARSLPWVAKGCWSHVHSCSNSDGESGVGRTSKSKPQSSLLALPTSCSYSPLSLVVMLTELPNETLDGGGSNTRTLTMTYARAQSVAEVPSKQGPVFFAAIWGKQRLGTGPSEKERKKEDKLCVKTMSKNPYQST